jgi:hypothetical protein
MMLTHHGVALFPQWQVLRLGWDRVCGLRASVADFDII